MGVMPTTVLNRRAEADHDAHLDALLLDQTEYLNHFYFVILLNILLVFVPANRVYVMDALIWRRSGSDPEQVYAGGIWIVRVQMEVQLVFSGVVTINAQ